MNTVPPEESLTVRTLEQMVSLDQGVITELDCEPAVARRLMELGLVPGTEVMMIRRAPLGDPLEIAVRGLHLTLRRSEASRIYVAVR